MSTEMSLRILIVRSSAIGDTIHTLPVLAALRDHLPHARLAWAVEQRSAGVLEGHEALDELIVAPRHWYLRPRATLALRRRLRAFAPHIAIDVQGVTKARWPPGCPARRSAMGRTGSTAAS